MHRLMIEDISDKLVAQAKAAMDKEPADMTEDEKFALCVCAGCDFTTEPTPLGLKHRFNFHTKHPCAVQRINGKLVVYELNPARK